MPYCPKCGEEVDEEMAFCPKCGASLRVQQPEDWRQQWRERRREWRERRRELRRQRREADRYEKGEEWEKNEKHLSFFIWPFVGVLVLAGLILMSLGVIFYLLLTGGSPFVWASFLVVIGLLVIAGAIYGIVMASRKRSRT
jgi:hypothetical protein